MTQEVTINVEHVLPLMHKEKEEIGRGRYGIVYKIKYSENIDLAVKEITCAKNKSCELVALQNELHNLQLVDSERKAQNIQGIVEFFGYIKDQNKYYIVLECGECSLDSVLFDKVNDQIVCYSFKIGLRWCKQISDAVKFLHSLKLPNNEGKPKPLMHRDLKPDNVVMFNSLLDTKITDFGLARLDSSKSMTTGAGTMRYMAPEVRGDDDLHSYYDLRCDVYSAAALFWEIFQRRKFQRKSVLPENVLFELLNNCLAKDYKLRPYMDFLCDQFEQIMKRFDGDALDQPPTLQDGLGEPEKPDDTVFRTLPSLGAIKNLSAPLDGNNPSNPNRTQHADPSTRNHLESLLRSHERQLISKDEHFTLSDKINIPKVPNVSIPAQSEMLEESGLGKMYRAFNDKKVQ